MILRLALVLSFTVSLSYGQSSDAGFSTLAIADTILYHTELDSIHAAAAREYHSIKSVYDSISTAVNEQGDLINRRIDSLRSLNLPVEDLQLKLDSLQQWKDDKLIAITSRVEKLRSDVNEKLSSINLPPELKSKASELSSAMDKLDISVPDYDLPVSLNNNLTDGLPGIKSPIGSSSLKDALGDKLEAGSLGGVGDQVSQYQDQLAHAPKNVEEVSKIAEEKITDATGVGDLQNQLGDAGKLHEMAESVTSEQEMKEKLTQVAKQQAMDHFTGQEEALRKAMETLAKYKQKYSSIEGLDKLPKRRPNEMRGKPIIERLVPGTTLQIHRKDFWMVDFNPYVGYRFNSKFSAGVGWNQRFAYDPERDMFNSDARIYGPRVYSSFMFGKGFSARAEVEYMNTLVPVRFSSGKHDPNGREWVPSAMAGLSREYKFYKNVKGMFHVLYNIYDPHHRSPYTNRLIMRMGFEFPMKKKMRT